MKKRWVNAIIPNQTNVIELAKELNIHPILAQLLVQRGITTFNQAKDFFRPTLSNLHDPFLMNDMEKAVIRIEKAIQNKEKILIYGDYDVDGTTAVALVYSFLNTFYKEIDFYIPDRYAEGYGISNQGIDFASANNFKLIIALDCGIKSIDKIEYANKNKIDFIICDHHRPGENIPNAIAVLDPKRVDCNYPFKELSGCGIGFKLIQAFSQRNNIDFSTLNHYLDLVAVSIAADIVPIVGENRVLAFYGLKSLNENHRKGFRAMLDLAGTKKERILTIADIVFIIAPRINAAGRLYSGKKAVELLLTETTLEAVESGQNLNDTNTERKNLDKIITEQALAILENNADVFTKKSTVVFHKEWHKGVVGIVASRLIEKYYRPTIVLTESNGLATGSARSVKDFDVYNAIESCSDLLVQFGGHKYAAGLSLPLENLNAFKIKFEKVVSSTIEEKSLIPEIEIDAQLNFADIDSKFYRILKQFAPFGPENMQPVFFTKKIRDTGFAKIVGNNHLKLTVSQAKNTQAFPAIGFGMAEHFDSILQKKDFDACYSIEENDWNGLSSLQLNLKDINF